MDWLLEPIQIPHMQRALLVGLLAGFANGYVSAFVVLKKSALMVGSLSHSLLPGIAIGVLVAGLTPASAFIGALVAGLIVGLGSLLLSRASRLGHETALAILYTCAFAAGVLLLSRVGDNVDLNQYLLGNILFASDADVVTVFWVSAIAITALTALRRPIIVSLFEPSAAQALGIPVRWLNLLLFGLLILVLISTLQAVGCILAIGLMVTPAATVYLLTDNTNALFWGGGLLGAVGSVTALLVAHHFNLGPSTSIVLTLGIFFALAYVLSPKYGLARHLRGRSATSRAAVPTP